MHFTSMNRNYWKRRVWNKCGLKEEKNNCGFSPPWGDLWFGGFAVFTFCCILLCWLCVFSAGHFVMVPKTWPGLGCLQHLFTLFCEGEYVLIPAILLSILTLKIRKYDRNKRQKQVCQCLEDLIVVKLFLVSCFSCSLTFSISGFDTFTLQDN